jgi:cytochrome bd ubiquinol oxidase subunit II
MNGPVASLNTAWFALIGLLWTGYLVLEGFDFGIGVLSLAIGRDDLDRRLARNAVGPVWDGNEVWLIVAAGATFAAFPVWYASMFSAFYLALFVMLVALIVRGVSFEFRGKRDSPRWRAGWDWVLAVGSLVPAFGWGVAFTDLVHGLPLSPAGLYLGGLPGLLPPVAVVGGLASLALFLAHGATFLSLKTAGPLAARAARVAAWLSPRPGPDLLERRLGAPDPAGHDRGRGDLRPCHARLPGLELLGVPPAPHPARPVPGIGDAGAIGRRAA